MILSEQKQLNKCRFFSPSFLATFLVITGIAAIFFWFSEEHIKLKTYVIRTEFVTRPFPKKNTPIMMGSYQIGFVGHVEEKANGNSLVDLNIYDSAYIRSKDLVGFDASKGSNLFVIPTSRFSRDESAVPENGTVFSIEIDIESFDTESFIEQLWLDKFKGLESLLEIDELFLR